MRITTLCLLTFLTRLLSAQALECSRASSEIEQLICKDAALTSLDRKLASVQTEAAAKMGAAKPLWLDPESSGWTAHRDACANLEDPKACLQKVYAHRIAEMQARAALVPIVGPVTFTCTESGGTKSDIVARFYQTDPSTAILEHDGKTILTYQGLSADGAKYESLNVMFWNKGRDAQVRWSGTELSCTVR